MVLSHMSLKTEVPARVTEGAGNINNPHCYAPSPKQTSKFVALPLQLLTSQYVLKNLRMGRKTTYREYTVTIKTRVLCLEIVYIITMIINFHLDKLSILAGLICFLQNSL